MKVMQRTSMKVVPGKMAEAMGLLQELQGIVTRYGMPPVSLYRPSKKGMKLSVESWGLGH